MVAIAAKRRQARVAKPSKIILVVEDEPTVLALAVSIIEDDLGYAALSAATAREALALLEQDRPIELLFTDINLPDGPDATDGLELARRAVEMRPGLSVIYTSGGGQTDGMAALFVDRSTFLGKPYKKEDLLQAVKGLEGACAAPLNDHD
jgi:CheY-like chemotaxis protein